MDESIACLSVMPGVSGRARAFALEATQRYVARGMAGYSATTDVKAASTAQANDILKRTSMPLSSAMAEETRAEVARARSDVGSYDPWSGTWFGAITGTSYDSSDGVLAKLAQAEAQISVDDSARGAAQREAVWGQEIARTQRDIQIAQQHPTLYEQPDVTRETFVSATEATERAACKASYFGKWDEANKACTLDASALKKVVLVAVHGLLTIGAGYVAITSYAQGRGARPASSSNRGRGRRNPPSSPRRPRPGTVHRAARRAA